MESHSCSGNKQSIKANKCQDSSSESMSCSDSTNTKSITCMQLSKAQVLLSKEVSISESAKAILSKSTGRQSSESMDSDSTRLHKSFIGESEQVGEGKDSSSDSMKSSYSSVISIPKTSSIKSTKASDKSLSTEDSSSSESPGMKLLTSSKLTVPKESSSESLSASDSIST